MILRSDKKFLNSPSSYALSANKYSQSSEAIKGITCCDSYLSPPVNLKQSGVPMHQLLQKLAGAR